jgi:hypothetical protein
VDDSEEGELKVTWPLASPEGILMIIFDENSISVRLESKRIENWYLEFSYDKAKILPCRNIDKKELKYHFRGFSYSVHAGSGIFVNQGNSDLRIMSVRGTIELRFTNNQ